MVTKYESGTRVGEYILEKCLGAGTFGEVWQARHHVWDNDQVAAKLPTEPEYVRFLQQEGVVVHGLRHPNIVRVMGLDPYAEIPYLIMELVRGPAVRQVLDKHPQGVPIDAAITIVRGVLRAMVAAHEAGVIHRDLKPGNVLLNIAERGLDTLTVDDVKVGDFGLGASNGDQLRSIVMQSASIAQQDEGATISGTLAYMAPEIREGRQKPDARTDLYSIGIILFELLTGERPAGAELPGALREGVPAALDEVYTRLYARYDRRYESAAAVLEDLDRRLSTPAEVPPVPGAVPPPPPSDRETQAKLHRHQKCPSCGQSVRPADQFCIACGRQLATHVRRCPSCGGYPDPEDSYCIFCGTALTGKAG